MDKKTIFAMVLIAIIIILMPYYQKYLIGTKPPPAPEEVTEEKADSLKQFEEFGEIPEETDVVVQEEQITEQEPSEEPEKPGYKSIIEEADQEKTIQIESDKIRISMTNRGGGGLKSFILKNYEKNDSTMVNMIDRQINNDIFMEFQLDNGDYVKTDDLLFQTSTDQNSVDLRERESFSIIYSLKVSNGELRKTYTFYNNVYHFDIEIYFLNPSEILLNGRYRLGWKNGLPSTETYVKDDYNYSQAYAYMAEELESFEIKEEGNKELVSLTGTASWLAVRTKYFITSLMNLSADVSQGVYFSGEGVKKGDYVQRLYDCGYYIKYGGGREGDRLRFYLGPLDHTELDRYEKDIDLLIMNNGWYERLFRPFSRYLVLPVLEFLNSFIPNYGVVIIIFSVLIKLVVYPLTKKSYKSMKEMQTIQPLMAEIREKYKSDPQRMNKEMMNLYKQHGVNPFGGCIPMLLQMPLLIALFIVFRSTIQLRGESFIAGWIPDLSRPDTIFTLPFSLPLYGDSFNILPILMALTMIFQSKMTMQDPKQKAMVYFMPVFMLLIFNQFPSGLNLYYTMFNLLTIVQQKFINKSINPDKEPAAKKKNIKKR